MWKRGEIAPKEQFLLFSTLFNIYIYNFRSQITHSFVKCGYSIYCFPHSLNSDMSGYGYSCKNSDIFHISAQNIDCGNTLEPPRRGGSNEYPQSAFLSRNKKKCIPL